MNESQLEDLVAANRILAAHGLEVTIEEEDDVIRQPVLGQPREAAEVGEEHRDLPLLSVARAHLQGGGLGRQ